MDTDFIEQLRELAAAGNPDAQAALRAGVASPDELEAFRSGGRVMLSEERWQLYQEQDLPVILDGAFERWGLGDAADLPADSRPRLPINIARLMREGVPPVPMLLDDWLVRADLHWLHADAAAGKTWVALILALRVMQQEENVAWFDEELGEEELTRRLLALGADPDLIQRRFGYWAYPSWSMTDKDQAVHRALLVRAQAELAVYDTATDMLTEAELDENSGIDVTKWVKAYPEVARQLGVTALVLDHTTKGNEGRHSKTGVGSRAKRAKAKVGYSMRLVKDYDTETLGRVEVELQKNTRGAAIPKKRAFECGGQDGKFVWTPVLFDLDTPSTDKALAQAALQDRVLDALRAHAPERRSITQVHGAVGGGKNKVAQVLADLAGTELYPVTVEDGPRGSLLYAWEPDTPAAD